MISIIIPTHNESSRLPGALEAIARNHASHETIVVDAGSSEGTIKIAQKHGARVVESSLRQRAGQMNLGGQCARGDILLFLHADTRLPETALLEIESALANPRTVGGAFARRYESRSLLLRVTCRLARWRCLTSGWFLGDQAIFVRRDVSERLGGFSNFNLFEDLDFSRRLRAAGRVVLLGPPVISSARRFAAAGPWWTTLSDLRLTWRYLRGEHPNDLAAEYSRRTDRAPQLVASARPKIAS